MQTQAVGLCTYRLPYGSSKKEFDYPDEDEDVNIRGYKLMGKANESQVKKVAEAIKGAKKPVILAGGGVVISDATNEFRKFVKRNRYSCCFNNDGYRYSSVGQSEILRYDRFTRC